jgi:hypothetical protein
MLFGIHTLSSDEQSAFSFYLFKELLVVKTRSSNSLLLQKWLDLNSTLMSLVELNGIEPLASCVQGRRSPS